MRKIHLMIVAIVLLFGAVVQASVIDAPHNETRNIRCTHCHSYALWWQYSPSTQHSAPEYKSIVSSVCMSCHDVGGSAPVVQTHSAQVMGSIVYHAGNWAIGCIDCHDPHYQEQLIWVGTSPSPYLITGTIDSVSVDVPQAGQSTITYSGATSDPEWPANGVGVDDLDWGRKNQSGRGLIFVHDSSLATNTFSIISATDSQIVVSGILDPVSVVPFILGNPASSNSFGLIYGQLIKSQIVTPTSGIKDVKFFSPLGGFVNLETPVSGVCQVCHVEAVHFRNTGEVNVGGVGLDHTDQAALNCIACHAHTSGFAHGLGGSGTGCGTTTECHGAKGSHPSHLDPAGLVRATCAGCHDTSQFPTFADGQKTIPATSVCTPCHDNGKGVFVAPPEWGAVSPPQCSECHAVSPSSGSHSKHLATVGIECANCHKGAVQGLTGPDQHLDGNIDVYIINPGDLGYPIDKAINSPEATCSVAACHGSGTPQWGGTVTCYICHVGDSDVDDYTYGNGVLASIDEAQWLASGHGLATGTYEVSGNPAANLIAAAGSGNVCAYCHDATINHGEEVNPFRLANSNLFGNGANDACLTCHGTSGIGYDPDGGGPMALNTATIKIDKNHHGQSHGVGNDGGSLCWDCHDPHGDRAGTTGNIFMIQAAVVKDKADTYGRPTATVAPIFTANTSASDYARTTSPFTGICQVCHASTTYYKNDSGANGHFTDSPCVSCHLHGTGTVDRYAFNHGGGSGDVATCQGCHGHDVGYGGVTGGKGTFATHSTHTENDADDLRGPNIGCNSCHNTSSMPDLADGVSYSAYKSGTPTTVCNSCHSPGGTYDGVNDPVVGAKENWQNGVYEANSSLKAGKEKWCATCHDENASIISGITAPNVIGDEGGAYTYGTGWGYYKTGHGLSAGNNFPSKGGVETLAGRPVKCDACHDYTAAHIDSDARTFNDNNSSATDPSAYRQGYRLKLLAVGTGSGASGREPLLVPWPVNTANTENASRLCLNCHASGPFLNGADMNTNLITDGVNRHEYHMNQNSIKYSADWDGTNNSRMTCVVCHNVHGSSRLAMVRDGKLTNREPGLMIWYNNDAIVSYNSSYPNPPVPENLPLSASTGTLWRGLTSVNLCAHCHGSNNTTPEYRVPFQNVKQIPVVSFTGETGYLSDGVSPDAAGANSIFVFRVSYANANNIAPSVMQVWVDVNDNGVYDAGEKYDMTAFVGMDINFVDGKIYTKSLVLAKAGDNTFNYRFYANDGTSDAVGSAVANGIVSVSNVKPVLTWTEESYYVADGVNPDTGGNGSTFTFRIKYVDTDNECPPAASDIQVWIDRNDDGDYGDAEEKIDMSAADANACSSGRVYSLSTPLTYAGDGDLAFTFRASDGTDLASSTAGPVNKSVVTVVSAVNSPPSLDWVSGSCFTGSVKPATGLATGNFEFRTTYTDPDNQAPSVIQVWIDTNDDGDYLDNGEKQNMTLVAGGDGNYANSEVYTYTTALAYAGDGALKFRFAAADSVTPAYNAIGTPTTTDSIVTVVSTANAKGVRSGGGGNPWYADIQSAIGTNDNITIFVYEGTYGTVNLTSRSNVTVRAVCGADLTVITGAGNLVFFQNCGDNTVDGFTILGGTNGVATNSITGTTRIKNSKIASVSAGISFGATAGSIVVENSEIYGNTTGVYMTSRTGHQFINTIIRNNGNGIFLQNSSATFTGCLIKESTNRGMLCNGATSVFSRSQFIANSATLGGAIYSGNATFNLTMENTIVAQNHATGDDGYGRGGGAFYATGGTVTIRNSTIADNSSDVSRGGVGFFQNTNVTMEDTILWNNTAAIEGHIIHTNSAGSLTITDTVMSNNGDSVYTNAPYFTGSITPVIIGYISEGDPGFISMVRGDYHIKSPSVAMDTGSTDLTIDIDGDFRPQGGGDDIGADEVLALNSVPTLSWSSESNYTTDGVNPDSGPGGSTFVFRVQYMDVDNTAPSTIQVWVDTNDNGVYDANEKYAMTVSGGDDNFANGEIYTKSLAIGYMGDGYIRYRFYASDGLSDATGSPTTHNMVYVVNSLPILTWTGEANYVDDGVHAESFIHGAIYTFRISYADGDNTAPSSIQVWVDKDDNGTYTDSADPALDERIDMTLAAGGDGVYTNGEIYEKAIVLAKPVDSTLTYRFYASDGTSDATGAGPIDNSSNIITLINDAPVLSWLGDGGNYNSDGVNPDSGPHNSNFVFKVKYTDANNNAPTSVMLWVDTDDSGGYAGGETYDMTIEGGDGDFANSEIYTKTLPLAYVGDGVLNYKFTAYDGADPASGTPVAAGATVTVTGAVNNAPVLAWTGEAGYSVDGVSPDTGGAGTNFTFRVKYSDVEGSAPSVIQVWVDKNNDADYDDAGEKVDLTPVAGGDYVTGKLYTTTVVLPTAGNIPYRFYSLDGAAMAAVGAPITAKTVTAANTVTVCASGCTFASLQSAINAASNGDFILVKNGSYLEKVTFDGSKNLTVSSENGAGSTSITGSNGDEAVVYFNAGANSSSVLDGFTIDNRSTGANARGIYVSGSTPTIKNSIITGNSAVNASVPDTVSGGAGIYVSNGIPFIDSCAVRSNAATNRNGGAIYITGAASGATITGSTIGGSGAANSAKFGAAIYYTGSSAGALVITDSTISYNASSDSGAGLFLNSITNVTVITGSSIINNSTTGGYGGGIYSASAPVRISNSHVGSNVIPTTRYGGGIYMSGATSSLLIENNSTVNSNTNGKWGGGIYLTGSTVATPFAISNSTVNSNTSVENGGGIVLEAISNASTFTNATIDGNTTGSSGNGAGVYANQAPVAISGGSISGNTGGSNRGGGGIYLGSATASNNSITATTINSNSTGSLGGGGIYLAGATSTLTLSKVKLQGNSATAGGGGGIRITAAATATISNCLITGNRIANTYNYGGGIRNEGTLNLYFSTVADNYSHQGGGLDCAGTEHLYNSIIYGNAVTMNQIEIRGATDTNYLTESSTNVDFVLESGASSLTATTDGNYHLQGTSNCINTGDATNAPSDDLDGNLRPVESFDKGAYEYIP